MTDDFLEKFTNTLKEREREATASFNEELKDAIEQDSELSEFTVKFTLSVDDIRILLGSVNNELKDKNLTFTSDDESVNSVIKSRLKKGDYKILETDISNFKKLIPVIERSGYFKFGF